MAKGTAGRYPYGIGIGASHFARCVDLDSRPMILDVQRLLLLRIYVRGRVLITSRVCAGWI